MNQSDTENTRKDEVNIWINFRDAFYTHLRSFNREELKAFWHEASGVRTLQYRKNILPVVSKEMGCNFVDCKPELYTFDAAFRQASKVGGYPIPVVLVESENCSNQAHHEIRKLLSILAPLRVLITWARWSKDRYPNDFQSGRLLEYWGQIIEEHVNTLQGFSMKQSGYLSFLIGECGKDEILRYYSFLYDFSGRQFTNQDVVEIGLT